MGISHLCSGCGRYNDKPIHILHNCVAVWTPLRYGSSLYPLISLLFSSLFNYKNWVFNHLNQKWIGATVESLKKTCMTTYWSLWNCKSKTIFEIDFKPPHNPVAVIQNFTKKISGWTSQFLHRNSQRNDTIYIGWIKSLTGGLKLNSDGTC